ncbi:MAG: radical SAM family heme chaperone HemW [Firmicutes bacterium]|nr:radical SAM family heme chaperone HemW [Bacillota bacterium]
MSIYIHIPFCSNICSYCDFCKFYYNEKWVDNYLKELEKEIKSSYKNELIDTIYIGGGTPSCLNIEQLKKLFNIISIFNLNKNVEFTMECNIDVEEEKLKLFKENNVNRISIGVQTINEKHLKFLNRNHTKEMVLNKINIIKKFFENINIDLMYALPNQTLEELKQDLEFFLSLDIPHISTYSLIIEPNTKIYIDNIEYIDEDLDYEMYKLINNMLKENNYIHYEMSNYSKKNYESKHNLTYWNNLEYYGFGIGASGYINNIRYDNTKSYNNYINGKYIKDNHELTLKEKIENEFILGFRKIKGINIKEFKNKYNIDLLELEVIKKLLKENKLVVNNNYIKINEEYLYTSNNILIEFVDMEDL